MAVPIQLTSSSPADTVRKRPPSTPALQPQVHKVEGSKKQKAFRQGFKEGYAECREMLQRWKLYSSTLAAPSCCKPVGVRNPSFETLGAASEKGKDRKARKHHRNHREDKNNLKALEKYIGKPYV